MMNLHLIESGNDSYTSMSVRIPTKSFDEFSTEFSTELNEFIHSLFPFDLDEFQKYAIHAIRKNEHCLITAHTGSGKSVPAEYAIHHFLTKNPDSVVIYTSPIKSLTNQKFHDFQGKFPEYSFGLLTGDMKVNPSAQCLLMTTEILRNALMRRDTGRVLGVGYEFGDRFENFENFELDLSRVACVVFDEIHYINDADRGSVWEESILWLPSRIPMVLLSATLDKAEEFAGWIAERKRVNVWYLSNERRVVPLDHHMMVCLPKNAYKKTNKDNFVRTMTQWMMSHTKTRECSVAPFLTEYGKVHPQNMSMFSRISEYLSKQDIRLSNSFVVNQMANALKHMDKLPAVVFVFNRKLTESMASMVREVMFPTEEGEYDVKGSIRHVGTDYQTTTMATQVVERALSILKKLPNWREYTETYEYMRLMDLMKKGVAYHHSGVHPVLREMVELLFQEGLIRLLFSTETLAVGVNMPARSVVMTSTMKWDGVRKRPLKSHEYTQMAGRAGRRGMDTRGYVYHLLWRDLPSCVEYESMLSGKPQAILSKFRLSSLTVLRVISALLLDGDEEDKGDKEDKDSITRITPDKVIDQLKSTMIQQEVVRQCGHVEREWRDIQEKQETMEKQIKTMVTPIEIMEEYHKEKDTQTHKSRPVKHGKHGKHGKRGKPAKSTTLAMTYPSLVREYSLWTQWNALCEKNNTMRETIEEIHAYIPRAVMLLLGRLEDKGLIRKVDMDMDEAGETTLTLSPHGRLMSQFHECPAEVVYVLDHVEEACRTKETMIELLAGLAGGLVRIEGNSSPHTLTTPVCTELFRGIEREQREEENWIRRQREQLDIQEERVCGFALVPEIQKWCVSGSTECSHILGRIQEQGIFVGEWVKVLLKMVNCARELAMVFEKMGKVGCVAQLATVPEMVMKSIVTNQSLYV